MIDKVTWHSYAKGLFKNTFSTVFIKQWSCLRLRGLIIQKNHNLSAVSNVCFDKRNSRIWDKLLNGKRTRNPLCNFVLSLFHLQFPFSFFIQNCLVKRQVSKGNIFVKFSFVLFLQLIQPKQQQRQNILRLHNSLFHFKMFLSRILINFGEY